jgi:hypothetical protein
MTTPPSTPPTPPSSGQHIASLSFEGRFWDVYLEFDEDPRHVLDGCRGILVFSPADPNEGEGPLRTIAVIVEDSYEEAMRRARGMDNHQLSAFLRSLLP